MYACMWPGLMNYWYIANIKLRGNGELVTITTGEYKICMFLKFVRSVATTYSFITC